MMFVVELVGKFKVITDKYAIIKLRDKSAYWYVYNIDKGRQL